jgi:hypothetical protein
MRYLQIAQLDPQPDASATDGKESSTTAAIRNNFFIVPSLHSSGQLLGSEIVLLLYIGHISHPFRRDASLQVASIGDHPLALERGYDSSRS